MRQLNNIPGLAEKIAHPERLNFWINDIGLFIPPTSISIHKEGLNYSIKSLRTKSSVKMASGNGVYHIQINMVFPPDALLQLHRLICQVKNNPFVFIENDFIKDSLEVDPLNRSANHVYATMMGLNVTNHPASPGTFTVELDLRYFNEKVYSENLGFKYEHAHEFFTGDRIVNVSFDIFDTEVINVVSEKEIDKSLHTPRHKTNVISSSIKNKSIGTHKVVRPRDSIVYKRYCNYLQVLYLNKYFNIKLQRQKTSDDSGFIISEEHAGIYINKTIADLLNKGSVGLHDLEYSSLIVSSPSLEVDVDLAPAINLSRLRQEIIHAMYLSSKYTRFFIRNFVTANIEPETHKAISKIVNQGIKKGMTRKEKYETKKKNIESLGKFLDTGNHKDFVLENQEQKFKVENGKSRDFSTTNQIKSFKAYETEEARKDAINAVNQANLYFAPQEIDNAILGKYSVINPFSEGEVTKKVQRGGGIELSMTRAAQKLFQPLVLPVDAAITDIDNAGGAWSSEEWGEFYFSDCFTPQVAMDEFFKINTLYKKGTIVGFLLNDKATMGCSKKLFDALPLRNAQTGAVSHFKGEELNSTFSKLRKVFAFINQSYQKYLGRKEVENIYMSERVLSILDYTDYEINQISNMSEGFTGNDFQYGDNAVITSISGALRHIVASIPILGQETPTHQFLGSIEPSYQFNLIGKNNFKSMPTTFLELEKMRADAQFFGKSFSIIPGASFVGVESMITKLLGSYEKYSRNIIEYGGEGKDYKIRQIIEKYNFSINSMDTYTIDGQPHSRGMNLRFDETRDYNEEEIRPAFTNQSNRKELNELYDKLIDGVHPSGKGTTVRKLSTDPSLYKALGTNIPIYDKNARWGTWKTKHYTADEYYKKIRWVNDHNKKKHTPSTIDGYMKFFAENAPEGTMHPDASAFYICQVLSQMQDYFDKIYKDTQNKMRIFSSIRYETRVNMRIIKNDSTDKRRIGAFDSITAGETDVKPYRSPHYLGGAVDIYYPGKNATEVLIYIYLMQLLNFIKDPVPNSTRSKRFLGLGIYGADAHKGATKMTHSIGRGGFIHIDLNYKVKEETLDATQSLYIEDYPKNSLRHWYGESGKDKYPKDTFLFLPTNNLFEMLLKYSDPKNPYFDAWDNAHLQIAGLETLDTYYERLIAAHKGLKVKKITGGSLKSKFISLADGA
jgi:hypothetical protein